jgi:hypothetical protein
MILEHEFLRTETIPWGMKQYTPDDWQRRCQNIKNRVFDHEAAALRLAVDIEFVRQLYDGIDLSSREVWDISFGKTTIHAARKKRGLSIPRKVDIARTVTL